MILYRLSHKNSKTENVLLAITLVSLLIGEMWFIGMFLSVNPNSMPLMDISKHQKIIPPKDVTYQIHINNYIIILHEAKEEKPPVLDVTGPFVPTAIGLITLILLLREKYSNYKKSRSLLHDENIYQEKEKQILRDVLKTRYAKGEITKEEFERLKKEFEL